MDKKMLQSDIFDMEWGYEDEKKELEIDAPFLFEEMERELKEYLLEQQLEDDSTDRPFHFIDNLTNKLQEDFDEIIGENNDQKSFIKSLTRIFSLLLNTKVNTVKKVKKCLELPSAQR